MRKSRKAATLALVLLFSCGFGLFASAANVEDFTDIPSGAWYKSELEYALGNGMVNGTTDTMFEPLADMTRAQFITILGRSMDVDKTRYSGSKFSDVSASQYYAPYVYWGVKCGIVNGISDTTFSPNATLTREQMAAMIGRAISCFGFEPETVNAGVSSFPDANAVSSYARSYVEDCWKAGLLKGDAGTGKIRPKDPVNRAEGTAVLARFKKSTEGQEAKISEKSEELNDENIPHGNVSDIVETQGILGEDSYAGILDESGWYLGIDNEDRILKLNRRTFNVERICENGETVTILENVMEDRGNILACAAWDGGSYIAWSESPHANEWDDSTMGADWNVCLANLQTFEITIIDQDHGLRPDSDSYYTYLTPANVSISDGYLSYVSYETRPDGIVTQAVKLYDIASGDLCTLAFLEGDPRNHAMGWSSVCNGRVAWSQAYVREDDMYEGYTTLYDCTTKETCTLETDKNVIKPILTDNYLVGENKPNQTYYDGEMVVYSFSEDAWKYRVTPEYYTLHNSRGNSLCDASAWKQYVAWTGSIMESVVILNAQDGILYTLAEDVYDVTSVSIYPGGLLVWGERYLDGGDLAIKIHYVILKA